MSSEQINLKKLIFGAILIAFGSTEYIATSNSLNNGLSVQTVGQPVLGSNAISSGGLGVNTGVNQQTNSILSTGLVGNLGNNVGALGVIQPAVGTVIGTGISAANTAGIAVNSLGGVTVGNTLGSTLGILNGVNQAAVGMNGGNAASYIVTNLGGAGGNTVGGVLGGNVANTVGLGVVYAVDTLGNIIGPVATNGELMNTGGSLVTGTGFGSSINGGNLANGGTILPNGGSLINLNNANLTPNVNLNVGGNQAFQQSNTNILSQQGYTTQINNPVSTTYTLGHAV